MRTQNFEKQRIHYNFLICDAVFPIYYRKTGVNLSVVGNIPIDKKTSHAYYEFLNLMLR